MAMGARIEHRCSTNRAVDVMYFNERYEFVSNRWAAHTHTHLGEGDDTQGGPVQP